MTRHLEPCLHRDVECINPYEIVRKYECLACRAVMMCGCTETFSRRHLPHQLSTATRLATKEKVPVTHGFQPAICNCCRGLPERAAPKAALPGHTSKIRRYYWREILVRSLERFGHWVDENGVTYKPLLHHEKAYREVFERLEHEVIDEIKAEHERQPKYEYKEKSAEEVLRANAVEVVSVDATYVKPASKGKSIAVDGSVTSVEDFVMRHFRAAGYDVLQAESAPIHLLFACLMFPVVCDPKDPLTREVMFADRTAFDRGERGVRQSGLLPSDFGSPGYGARRADATSKLLQRVGRSREALLATFDMGFDESTFLRQYLWAHRLDTALVTKKLLSIVPSEVVVRILKYLMADYWRHYTGWPDLVVSRVDDYFFAEVKGSGDTLSEEQKGWIEANRKELLLPFKLVRVHRRKVVPLPT